MVYFVRFGESDRVKVGRSKNLVSRLKTYEGVTGLPAICLAQIIVPSAEEMADLEVHALDCMRRMFPSFKLEWFSVPTDGLLASVIVDIVSSSPVAITEVRGRPGAEDEVKPFHSAYSHESFSAANAYRMRRRGTLR